MSAGIIDFFKWFISINETTSGSDFILICSTGFPSSCSIYFLLYSFVSWSRIAASLDFRISSVISLLSRCSGSATRSQPVTTQIISRLNTSPSPLMGQDSIRYTFLSRYSCFIISRFPGLRRPASSFDNLCSSSRYYSIGSPGLEASPFW